MRKALRVLACVFTSALFGTGYIQTASAVTCFSTNFAGGGLNGTGGVCTASTIYTNTPDPTANAAPQLQDQTLNGSPLLASLSTAGTLNGFTVTVTSQSGADLLAGSWSYTPPTSSSLFPKYVEIAAGGSWFFTEVALGTTSGTWSTCSSGLGGSLCLENPPGNAALGLSHIAFFDGQNPGGAIGPPAETPLPAALPLFAGGVATLGLLGWRRKRKAPAIS